MPDEPLPEYIQRMKEKFPWLAAMGMGMSVPGKHTVEMHLAVPPPPSPFMVIGGISRIDRLKDGRVMCPMCVEYKWPSELYVDEDGQMWDNCWPCQAFNFPVTFTWPGHEEHYGN